MGLCRITSIRTNNCEDAIKKAEKEFKIYREREMKELQSDFDLLMKSLPNNK